MVNLIKRVVAEDEIDNSRLEERDRQQEIPATLTTTKYHWVEPKGKPLTRSSWFIERVCLGVFIATALKLLYPFRDWFMFALAITAFLILLTHWTGKKQKLWIWISLALIFVSGFTAILRSSVVPSHMQHQLSKTGKHYPASSGRE